MSTPERSQHRGSKYPNLLSPTLDSRETCKIGSSVSEDVRLQLRTPPHLPISHRGSPVPTGGGGPVDLASSSNRIKPGEATPRVCSTTHNTSEASGSLAESQQLQALSNQRSPYPGELQSILRVGTSSRGISKARPSVSFAKEKAVLTFQPEDDRSSAASGRSSAPPVQRQAPEIRHVPMSPLSERNVSRLTDGCSLLASSSSGQQPLQRRLTSGNERQTEFLNTNIQLEKLLPSGVGINPNGDIESDNGDFYLHSPAGSEASSNWIFPSIEELATTSAKTAPKIRRSSLLNSPAPTYRFGRVSVASDQADLTVRGAVNLDTPPVAKQPFIPEGSNEFDLADYEPTQIISPSRSPFIRSLETPERPDKSKSSSDQAGRRVTMPAAPTNIMPSSGTTNDQSRRRSFVPAIAVAESQPVPPMSALSSLDGSRVDVPLNYLPPKSFSLYSSSVKESEPHTPEAVPFESRRASKPNSKFDGESATTKPKSPFRKVSSLVVPRISLGNVTNPCLSSGERRQLPIATGSSDNSVESSSQSSPFSAPATPIQPNDFQSPGGESSTQVQYNENVTNNKLIQDEGDEECMSFGWEGGQAASTPHFNQSTSRRSTKSEREQTDIRNRESSVEDGNEAFLQDGDLERKRHFDTGSAKAELQSYNTGHIEFSPNFDMATSPSSAELLQSYPISLSNNAGIPESQIESLLPCPAAVTVDGQKLYTPRSAATIFTPRTASRRSCGPVKVSQTGIWEQFNDGTGRVTPRLQDFNPSEIKFARSSVGHESELLESERRMSTLPEEDEDVLTKTGRSEASSACRSSYSSDLLTVRTKRLQSPCAIESMQPNEELVEEEERLQQSGSTLYSVSSRGRRRGTGRRSSQQGHSRRESSMSTNSAALPPIILDRMDSPYQRNSDDSEESEGEDDGNASMKENNLSKRATSSVIEKLPSSPTVKVADESTFSASNINRSPPRRMEQNVRRDRGEVEAKTPSVAASVIDPPSAASRLLKRVSPKRNTTEGRKNRLRSPSPYRSEAGLPLSPQRETENSESASVKSMAKSKRVLVERQETNEKLRMDLNRDSSEADGNNINVLSENLPLDFFSPQFGASAKTSKRESSKSRSLIEINAFDVIEAENVAKVKERGKLISLSGGMTKLKSDCSSMNDDTDNEVRNNNELHRRSSSFQKATSLSESGDENRIFRRAQDSLGNHQNEAFSKALGEESVMNDETVKQIREQKRQFSICRPSMEIRQIKNMMSIYERHGCDPNLMMEGLNEYQRRLSMSLTDNSIEALNSWHLRASLDPSSEAEWPVKTIDPETTFDQRLSTRQSETLEAIKTAAAARPCMTRSGVGSELTETSKFDAEDIGYSDRELIADRDIGMNKPIASGCARITKAPVEDIEGKEERQCISRIPALPELGVEWNEFQAARSPYLNEEQFFEPELNLDRIRAKIEQSLFDPNGSHSGVHLSTSKPEGSKRGEDLEEEAFDALRNLIRSMNGISFAQIRKESESNRITAGTLDQEDIHTKICEWVQRLLPLGASDNWLTENLVKRIVIEYEMECWNERLDELIGGWGDRYAAVERMIGRFPAEMLPRRQLQWTIGKRAGRFIDAQKLQLLAKHMAARHQYLPLKANAEWEFELWLPVREGVNSRLRSLTRLIESSIGEALKEAERIRRRRDQVEQLTKQISTRSEFLDAKQVVLEQLQTAVEFQHTETARVSQRLKDRQHYCAELSKTVTKVSEEVSHLEGIAGQMVKTLNKHQAFLQLLTLQKDMLEVQQLQLGYKLTQFDLDHIEVQNMTAMDPFVKSSSNEEQRLLNQYLTNAATAMKRSNQQKLKQPERLENAVLLTSETNGDFTSWNRLRCDLLDQLFMQKLRANSEQAKQLRNVTLLGLATVPESLITAFWLYDQESPKAVDEADPRVNRVEQHENHSPANLSSPTPIVNGLKLNLNCRLRQNLEAYLPIELQQMALTASITAVTPKAADDVKGSIIVPDNTKHSFKLLGVDKGFLKEGQPVPQLFRRRFTLQKLSEQEPNILLGLSHIFFDWETRKVLQSFAETRLKNVIDLENKELRLPRPSPVQEFLHRFRNKCSTSAMECQEGKKDDVYEESLPMDLFAPACGSERVLQWVTKGLICARRIEMLISQQRELLFRHFPLGRTGAEVIYIPAGSQVIDYREVCCHPRDKKSIISSERKEMPNVTIPSADNPRQGPILQDDEIIFHIIVRSQSTKSLQIFVPVEISVTLVCNLAMSFVFGSFVHGIRQSVSGIFFDEPDWYLTKHEGQLRSHLRKAANKCMNSKIRALRSTSRIPSAADLADVVNTSLEIFT